MVVVSVLEKNIPDQLSASISDVTSAMKDTEDNK